MKINRLFFVALLSAAACAGSKVPAENPSAVKPAMQAAQEKVNFASPETWLLGYFRPERFTARPHSEWYNPGYDSYKYSEDIAARLLNLSKDDLTIKIVVGTWCPDSRREVPHFMRIMTAINFPADKIEFLGVDNNKFSPVTGYEALGIEKVPTFIFYLKNIEAGRIIENPVTSLEQDMLQILSK